MPGDTYCLARSAPSDPAPEEVDELPTHPDPDPELQEGINEEVPTAEELTDEAIVEAILNPTQPELIELEDDDEDEEEPQPPVTLRHTIRNTEELLMFLMQRPNLTDSLYFASLIRQSEERGTPRRSRQTLPDFSIGFEL